jgi:hypothetical protein
MQIYFTANIILTFAVDWCFKDMKLLGNLSKGVDFDHGFQNNNDPAEW